MTATLIDGKLIAQKIFAKTADKVDNLRKKGIVPKLGIILVGEDKPSKTYVHKKMLQAKKVGIEVNLDQFPQDVAEDTLIAHLNKLQIPQQFSGIIVQLPLPGHLDKNKILNTLNPDVDVDCLTETNLGKIVTKTNYLVPPTPGAIIRILHELQIDLPGKNVTIIGTGALVGKPLAIMLMNEEASVTTGNDKTRNIKEKCLTAEIIISAVGKKNLITGDMVPPGAVVIDAGVSFVNGKIYGDVNAQEVISKASFLTPTPGGVGPITVARILWNTALCAEKNYDTH